MKVVQLVASPYKGGMEKHVIELSNSLTSFGNEVIIIGDSSLAPFLNKRVRLIELNFNKSRYNPVLLYTIFKLIRKIKPDILHCHGSKASIIISTLKPLLTCKCITTVHGIKKNVKYLYKFDHIICVSNFIKTRLSEETKSTTVYNGINKFTQLSNIQKEHIKIDLKIPSDKFIWVAVGRLVKVKGFDQIIKAMNNNNGYLIIVGDGPERSSLENIIDDYNLRNSVKLLGHRDDVPEIIQCADQLIISSLRDGFSYVFLEAMFAKIPVISSDVPVANEILPEEMIYPVGDFNKLSEIMLREFYKKSDMSEIMNRCYNELSIDNMTRKTNNLYIETLENNKENLWKRFLYLYLLFVKMKRIE